MPTDAIGDTTTHSLAWQGTVWVWPVIASNSGSLSSVGINLFGVNAGSNTRLAIYTDNAGAAGTLLGQSADTVGTAGWMDLAITGVSIVSGTKYWIGFQAQNNQLEPYRTSSGGSTLYTFSQAYGSFPTSPAWSSGSSPNIVNLRMTYSDTMIGLPSSHTVPVITVQQW